MNLSPRSVAAESTLETRASADPEAARAKARQKARDEAHALGKRKDFAGAERVLEALNRQPAGSAESELETGHALVGLAFVLAAQGDEEATMEVVRRALARLARVEAKLGRNEQPELAAAAKQLAAVVQERFVGDVAAAKALNREAVRLDAKQQLAAEALERLEKNEAAQAARGQKGGE